MNSCIRAILISAACITTAYAQPGSGNGYANLEYVYDVNIEMLGVQSTPVTISGMTTLASSCAAAFCAGYVRVNFSNSIDGTALLRCPPGTVSAVLRSEGSRYAQFQSEFRLGFERYAERRDAD